MKARIIISLVVILFTSCNETKKDEPLIFKFRSVGGWDGLDENLEINASTTHYSISYFERKTRKTKSYQTTIDTSEELWNHLTTTFKLEIFTKIKNGPCRSCIDLYDDVFYVIKDGETYSFYNGYDDEHFQQMQGFFGSIIKLRKDIKIIAESQQEINY